MHKDFTEVADAGEVRSCYISRQYDLTPKRVHFAEGGMAELLMRLARYLVKDTITEKWRAVTFEEYMNNPTGRGRVRKALPKWGIVELCAQSSTDLGPWRNL